MFKKFLPVLLVSGLFITGINPAYATTIETPNYLTSNGNNTEESESDTESDTKSDTDTSTDTESISESDNTSETDNKPSILSNTEININISEKTIEALTEMQDSKDLTKYEYTVMTVDNENDISTGDIMILDEILYICIKYQGDNLWWKLEDDCLTCDTSVHYDKSKSTVYSKKLNETAYPVINNLTGYENEKLKTVALPKNFRWVNENTIMEGVGEHVYSAYYIPEDFINDKTALINIKVTVSPHLDVATIGSKYVVKYVPHITASMVGIPEGWVIKDPDQELEIGTNTITVTYKFPDGSTAIEKVKVIVEKGELNVNCLMITVIEGTKLTDEILPKISNGTFKWDEDIKGKIITSNTNEKCIFVPDDTDNYDILEDISVIINVIPKSFIDDKDDENTDVTPTPSPSETPVPSNTPTPKPANNIPINKNDGIPTNTPTPSKDKSEIAVITQEPTTEATTEATTKSTKSKTTKKKNKTTKKVSQIKITTKKNTNTTSNSQSSSTKSNSVTSPNSIGNSSKTISIKSTNNKDQSTDNTNKSVSDAAKKSITIKPKDSKSNNANNSTSKIQMRDIDLTKKTADKNENNNGRIAVETLDLTKKNEEKHSATDANIIKLTRKGKDVHSVTDATTEVSSENTENATEITTEAKVEVKKKGGITNVIKFLIVGITVLLTGGAIFLIRYLKRRRITK